MTPPVSTWLILTAAATIWLGTAAWMLFQAPRPVETVLRLTGDPGLRRRVFLPVGAVGLVVIAIQLVSPGARDLENGLNLLAFALAGGCVWLSLNAFLTWRPSPAYLKILQGWARSLRLIFRWVVAPFHIGLSAAALFFLIRLHPFTAL
ncbi:hypothetical protein [Maricaulis salignorans]|uniref:Uncharacterized protein n=1 Tax=Maricaulis salignorans TaxID=144026 RepID=A0A1G9S1F5_9PROT|nr:hypothetical protein [Maricaulis salignorans]SDM28575.1 hypothetical protein SAMN04488568_10854 [Maricaulis salignorans]